MDLLGVLYKKTVKSTVEKAPYNLRYFKNVLWRDPSLQSILRIHENAGYTSSCQTQAGPARAEEDQQLPTEIRIPGSSLVNSSRPGGGFDETGEVPVPLQYVVVSFKKT